MELDIVFFNKRLIPGISLKQIKVSFRYTLRNTRYPLNPWTFGQKQNKNNNNKKDNKPCTSFRN